MKIAHALAGILPAALAAATRIHTYNLPLPIANHNIARNSSAPSFTFDELFGLQKKFLDAFVYPANRGQVRSAVRGPTLISFRHNFSNLPESALRATTKRLTDFGYS